VLIAGRIAMHCGCRVQAECADGQEAAQDVLEERLLQDPKRMSGERFGLSFSCEMRNPSIVAAGLDLYIWIRWRRALGKQEFGDALCSSILHIGGGGSE
jgi:hypothetical protein